MTEALKRCNNKNVLKELRIADRHRDSQRRFQLLLGWGQTLSNQEVLFIIRFNHMRQIPQVLGTELGAPG